MERKEYFKKLVALFEEVSEEEVVPASQDQYNIDAGANVDGNTTDQAGKQAASDSESDVEANSDLGDANYLSTAGEVKTNLPPIGDSIEVPEPKKMAKLFDLFKDLLSYSEIFYESLTNNIDMNLLSGEKVNKLKKNIDQVTDVVDKIRIYITDTFPTEKYEKALYVYILLRTELMTIIKLLRESLGLNVISNDDDKSQLLSKNDKNTQK